MSDEQKATKIFHLVMTNTYPKDQLGLYTEQMLLNDILAILRGMK